MNVDAPLRNVDVDTTAPIAQWPAEAIEIMMDRGSLSDWRLLVAEIERDPWGTVARSVETIASWDEHYGVDRLMARVIGRARGYVDDEARAKYAKRIRRLRRGAGLTLKQLALAAGTSESRLSAYENGRVAPTTVVLGRIETVIRAAANREQHEHGKHRGVSFGAHAGQIWIADDFDETPR